MLVRRRGVRRRADRAAALRSQEVLVPAVADVPADEFLAAAVVDRGVDQVDPAIEHRAQEPAGLVVADRRASRLAAQFHGAVAEDGHVGAGPSQGTRLDRHACTLSAATACPPPGFEHSLASMSAFTSRTLRA
jgi:hypothetical protein